jgi:Flp pilus assembly CpaF family ATPase
MRQITHEEYVNAFSICLQYREQLLKNREQIVQDMKLMDSIEPLLPDTLIIDVRSASVRLLNIIKDHGQNSSYYFNWGIGKRFEEITVKDLSKVSISNKIITTRNVGPSIVNEIVEITKRAGLNQEP